MSTDTGIEDKNKGEYSTLKIKRLVILAYVVCLGIVCFEGVEIIRLKEELDISRTNELRNDRLLRKYEILDNTFTGMSSAYSCDAVELNLFIKDFCEDGNIRCSAGEDRIMHIRITPNTIVDTYGFKGMTLEKIGEYLLEKYPWGGSIRAQVELGEVIDTKDGTEVYEAKKIIINFSSAVDLVIIPMDDLPDISAAKPVIYLYPEDETEVDVNLIEDEDFKLTCTYPKYEKQGDWKVKAYPDGKIESLDGKGKAKRDGLELKEYNYLYWEGEANLDIDFSEGFCIAGEDSAKFLEEKLEILGLNRKEANEFIVYWLPILEQNKYNKIKFLNNEYTDTCKLSISPNPDNLIRVFMAFEGIDNYEEIVEQELNKIDRGSLDGFTVVEWGGTKIN